ncbi:MAG: hypothetical protein CXT75_11695 [Methanobacteriota archaeon]|jgi:uncharacterized protein with PQ loop repeat|nr:MAG: hypothetical protein CXT75_11695 [Euryarchaeota archaeon]
MDIRHFKKKYDKAKITKLAKEYDKLQKKQPYHMTKKINDTTVTLLYFGSFLVPLAGVIVGAIYISKDEEHYKYVGKNCLIWALINIILTFIFLASLFA